MLHKAKLIEELKNSDWDFKTIFGDVNGTHNKLIDCITNSLDKHCPYEFKRIQINNRNKPWLSITVTACKKICFYINLFCQRKTVKAESKYKQYKNML